MFDDSFKARYRTLPVAIYTHPQRQEPSSFVPHNHREIEKIAIQEGEACFFYVKRHGAGSCLLIGEGRRPFCFYKFACYFIKYSCNEWWGDAILYA